MEGATCGEPQRGFASASFNPKRMGKACQVHQVRDLLLKNKLRWRTEPRITKKMSPAEVN
jgi:hypothetical protein